MKRKYLFLLMFSLLFGCSNHNATSSLEESSSSEESTSETLSSILSSEELTSEITSILSTVTSSSEESSIIISNITSEIISSVTSEQENETSSEEQNSESTNEAVTSETILSEEISSIVSESIISEISSIVSSESLSEVTSEITTSIVESLESSEFVLSESISSEEESSEEISSEEDKSTESLSTSEEKISETTSETASNESFSSNEEASSEEESSEVVVQKETIKNIKDKAQDFLGKENSVGVYESNIEVEIELKLLACLDAITTKTGYGDRYKILMTDGNDYIYVKTTDKNYQYLKDYVNDQGVYKVKGNISLYNKEVEITVKEKPVYLSSENIDIDYDSLAELKTLEETYALMNNLTLNCKGIGFSQIVKVEVKCLAKDINNTNLYFGKGNYIINVHGNDKVTNKFVVGNSYTFYGALNVHNFRPGLEFVYATSLNKDIEFSTEDLEVKTAANFYKYTYEVDKYSSYPDYSRLFEKPYVIEGYANLYVKDGKEYIVLEDKYKANVYNTYQNARDAKAVFFVNENYIKLTSSNAQYCPMYEHLMEGTKLRVVIFPYLWNTQKYPQVYCYSFETI